MHIVWKGQSCFQITAAAGKGEQARLDSARQVLIAVDPFDESTGLKPPAFSADILLVTHEHFDHNNKKAISGNPSAGSRQVPFLIEGPGEYERKGVFVEGIPSFHDDKGGKERGQNTIYTIEAEDMRLCHLGDLGQKELTPEQVEKIGEIDVLMIPVGGSFTIDAKEAAKIISQIEPKIVIPMHYLIPKLKIKIDAVDKFLKEMGVKSAEPQEKLLIKKKDLSEEETKIVVLQA